MNLIKLKTRNQRANHRGISMTQRTMDHEIHDLQDEVLLLGSMVEQAMLSAITSLKHRDFATSQRIIKEDNLINEKQYAIENRVLHIFSTQQPVARDLRMLAAIFDVVTDLERMGDYAKRIARINLKIGKEEIQLPIREISRMGDVAVEMLHRALSAFINADVQMAYRIPEEDDLVDGLYKNIYRKTINNMIANPEDIDRTNDIIWVAHNIERMADRVTNICKRTIFIATGEMVKLDFSGDEFLDLGTL